MTISIVTTVSRAQTRFCVFDQNGNPSIEYKLIGLQSGQVIVSDHSCLPVSTVLKDRTYKLVISNPVIGQNKDYLYSRKSDEDAIGADKYLSASALKAAYIRSHDLKLYIRPTSSNLNPKAPPEEIKQ